MASTGGKSGGGFKRLNSKLEAAELTKPPPKQARKKTICCARCRREPAKDVAWAEYDRTGGPTGNACADDMDLFHTVFSFYFDTFEAAASKCREDDAFNAAWEAALKFKAGSSEPHFARSDVGMVTDYGMRVSQKVAGYSRQQFKTKFGVFPEQVNVQYQDLLNRHNEVYKGVLLDLEESSQYTTYDLYRDFRTSLREETLPQRLHLYEPQARDFFNSEVERLTTLKVGSGGKDKAQDKAKALAISREMEMVPKLKASIHTGSSMRQKVLEKFPELAEHFGPTSLAGHGSASSVDFPPAPSSPAKSTASARTGFSFARRDARRAPTPFRGRLSRRGRSAPSRSAVSPAKSLHQKMADGECSDPDGGSDFEGEGDAGAGVAFAAHGAKQSPLEYQISRVPVGDVLLGKKKGNILRHVEKVCKEWEASKDKTLQADGVLLRKHLQAVAAAALLSAGNFSSIPEETFRDALAKLKQKNVDFPTVLKEELLSKRLAGVGILRADFSLNSSGVKTLFSIAVPWHGADDTADFDAMEPLNCTIEGSPLEKSLRFNNYIMKLTVMPLLEAGSKGEAATLTFARMALAYCEDVPDELDDEHSTMLANLLVCFRALSCLLDARNINYRTAVDEVLNITVDDESGCGANDPRVVLEAALSSNKFYKSLATSCSASWPASIRAWPNILQAETTMQSGSTWPFLKDTAANLKTWALEVRSGMTDRLLDLLATALADDYAALVSEFPLDKEEGGDVSSWSSAALLALAALVEAAPLDLGAMQVPQVAVELEALIKRANAAELSSHLGNAMDAIARDCSWLEKEDDKVLNELVGLVGKASAQKTVEIDKVVAKNLLDDLLRYLGGKPDVASSPFQCSVRGLAESMCKLAGSQSVEVALKVVDATGLGSKLLAEFTAAAAETAGQIEADVGHKTLRSLVACTKALRELQRNDTEAFKTIRIAAEVLGTLDAAIQRVTVNTLGAFKDKCGQIADRLEPIAGGSPGADGKRWHDGVGATVPWQDFLKTADEVLFQAAGDDIEADEQNLDMTLKRFDEMRQILGIKVKPEWAARCCSVLNVARTTLMEALVLEGYRTIADRASMRKVVVPKLKEIDLKNSALSVHPRLVYAMRATKAYNDPAVLPAGAA